MSFDSFIHTPEGAVFLGFIVILVTLGVLALAAAVDHQRAGDPHSHVDVDRHYPSARRRYSSRGSGSGGTDAFLFGDADGHGDAGGDGGDGGGGD